LFNAVKKFVQRAFFLGAISFVLILLAYARWIHVDDQRITMPEAQAAFSHSRFVLHQGLFLNQWSHQISITFEKYEAELDRFLNLNLARVIAKSERFSSIYQLFLSEGTYPERLEGRDVILLPTGVSLSIQPKVDGVFQLQMVATATTSNNSVQISHNDKPISLNRLDAIKAPKDTKLAWYRLVERFTQVESSTPLSKWLTISKDLILQSSDTIDITCEGERGAYCLVGEPTLYISSPDAKNNFIIVNIDTLRHDSRSQGFAPNMDDFFAKSLQFTNALAPGNMTSPSTNALLSCRKPSDIESIAFAYGISPPVREAYYQQHIPSFPEVFTRGGFETTMIGSISVTSEILGGGINHGFRNFYSLEQEGYENKTSILESVRWLRSNYDKRFFLYIHLNAPHAPYRAPLSDLVQTFPGWKHLRDYSDVMKWLYQGEVHYTDRVLGLLFKELRDLRLFDDTTIVVTSDHGDQHQAINLRDNLLDDPMTGAFFDHGATLLNDEIRVPLAIRSPGLPKGTVSEFSSTLALGPTLMKIANLPTLPSCSLPSVFEKEEGPDASAQILGSEGFRARSILYEGRFKYIRTYEKTSKRFYQPGTWSAYALQYFTPESLYDLLMDPEEKHNLAARANQELMTARDHFEEYYGLRRAYELIVQTTESGELFLKSTSPLHLIDNNDALSAALQNPLQIAPGTYRLKFFTSGDAGEQLPTLYFNGQAVALRFTKSRLPLSADAFENLFVELDTKNLLTAEPGMQAYLVNIFTGDKEVYEIKTMNSEFEKVLREWGYINDQE
jgi:arylsulfatase A-like enzyme